MERLWLTLPHLPSPMPSVAPGVQLGTRAPSAPLPALAEDSKPPALVLGGGTAQARLWVSASRDQGLGLLSKFRYADDLIMLACGWP